MNKLYIFTATDEETRMMEEILDNLQEKAALYKLVTKDIELIQTGVGPTNVAKTILEGYNIDKSDIILNIGLAGYNGNPTSRFYQITKSYNLDQDLRPLGEENFSTPKELSVFTSLPTADCYSSNAFVTKALAEFRNLPQQSVCDMELNTITELVPCKVYSIKFISDTLNGGQYSDNLQQCIELFKTHLVDRLPSIINSIRV